MSFEIDIQKIQQLESLELIAKQVVEGFITGLHKSPFHGFSVEFAEHRLYNTGESTKHVDWKLYARTQKLFVKRYEEETNLRCQIIIDASSSMYFPEYEQLNKLKFSIYAAASLMNLLKKQRDAFGLSIYSEELDIHTPVKSSTIHFNFLLKELERLINQPNQLKKTSAIKSLHTIAESIHKRSLVVIFSDMFENVGKQDEVFAALQHLKHNKHEVILFHVMDKDKELDFNFENRPYQFIDMETGEEVKLHPNEIKDSYLEETNQLIKDLKLRCGQYGIDFVEADISKGFHSVLLSYLIKRKKMM
ncbi:MAG: DUF58 domain-containing protein [Flavobacteriales bacterium]|nr:DUF58 domain-containing protein [Flavobacteriales bacterium]MCB9334726.1 DUF58 domain-containing protein [Flavobacteriales bacterium]